MLQINQLIKDLLKNEKLEKIILSKITTFKKMQKKSSFVLFQELCYCILTANFNAKRAIEIQEKIKDGFNTFSEEQLAKKLKELGHRFPNNRAKYIVDSRQFQKDLKKILLSFNNTIERREWLVKNIKGFGYKEASHFLRNIGFLDVAIIDFHIVDILVDYNVIKKPKTMTKKEYLLIENKLKKIAKEVKLSLGELDLYLWFSETKTIYK
jgi:N-glycosylase/DNA lyase